MKSITPIKFLKYPKMKTKYLNSYFLPVAGIVALSSSFQKAEAAAIDQKPNVILVMTDDQGYGDLACLGNEIIKTPNIDKFYDDAVRLTDFHVSPTSAPTRSALMTGRYSDRVGVWHTVGGRSLLWEDETTLAQMLSSNGYVCGIFGKWHLGDNYPSRPQDKGFKEVLIHGGGGIGQGPDYWGNDYFDDHYLHNGEWEEYSGYCTDVFTQNALNFIKENKDKPFFCYLPLNAPHDPLNLPEEYLDMYRGNEKLLEDQQRFYGMITNVDDNFGVLISELDKMGLSDNTIVIFMTDNGTAKGIQVVDGVTYGCTGGRSGKKGSIEDGGHRVPFFIRYPDGGLSGGYDIDRLAAHIDLMPTIMDMCDLKDNIDHKPFDGKSLKPLFINQSSWPDRTIVVDSQRRQNLIKWRLSSVMTQQWRLLNGAKLFDIQADPMQTTDLAAQYPEVVARLRADYEAWWKVLEDERVNERYAYIVAGSDAENPVKLSAHDQHTENFWAITQGGVLKGENPVGIYKIEIAKTGTYTIELCRYPKESGYKFNSKVKKAPDVPGVRAGLSEAKEINLVLSELNIAQHSKRQNVDGNSTGSVYTVELEAGRYDLDAFLEDENGVKYPPYYIYIEKK